MAELISSSTVLVLLLPSRWVYLPLPPLNILSAMPILFVKYSFIQGVYDLGESSLMLSKKHNW